MRLLNTTTGELKDFTNAPPYAILSHRWGDNEVSYDEYCIILEANTEDATPKDKRRAADIMSRSSYLKIVRFCLLAREKGVGWAWCDTCCIDKRSSAELSEAINSMWTWYSDAKMCLVFLSDVPPVEHSDHGLWFRDSEWFRRGWTLQELLAPSLVLFYAKDWSFINMVNKTIASNLTGVQNQDFLLALSGTTRIPTDCLCSLRQIQWASIAQKMSWASSRSTTRAEDQAYCLLGLFDVHMPLLYGEGRKAFGRLQRAILEISDDESIFAWRATFQNRLTAGRLGNSGMSYAKLFQGMLAEDIRDFASCGSIECDYGVPNTRLPYTATNKGLDITAEVTLVKVEERLGKIVLTYVLLLGRLSGERCALALRCPAEGPEGALIAIGRCYVEPNSIDEILRGYSGPLIDDDMDWNHAALKASIGKTSTRRLFVKL